MQLSKNTAAACLYYHTRAVGAGPAAAGPIFGQLSRTKMTFGGLFNRCSINIATIEGTSDDMTAVIYKISSGAGGKHTLSPEESKLKFWKTTLTIDRVPAWAWSVY